MKHFFETENVTIREINHWTDNKWIYWGNLVYRGICSAYINSQKKKTTVFVGQCNFGYKLTPHVNRNIIINELIHMFDPKFTWVWAPFIQFINIRVIVGEVFRSKFEKCYRDSGIPEKYLERLKVIFYRLEYLPEKYFERKFELPLKIYYAGRGGPQKRLWIIIDVIRKCRSKNLPVQFKLAGPFKSELPNDLILDGTYVGEIKGGNDMYDFHKSNDILLMTSAWEGFPLVIMEAMAFGTIPLVSEIDAIPEHIQHGVNGYLIRETINETEMIHEICETIVSLIGNCDTLKSNSKNAFKYALENFGEENFRTKYREIMHF
jgi:glycosyltransferase involved in cell wall biosynthesis